MASIEAAEVKFSEQASSAHATFVDMNIPMAKAVAECEKMLATRFMLMGMYGMNGAVQAGGNGGKSWGKGSWAAPQGAWAAPQASWAAPQGAWGAPAWPMQAAAASQGQGVSTKSSLMEAIQSAAKETQTSITKGAVVYETTGDRASGFSTTLTSPDWLSEPYYGTSHESKKASECMAARKALQANYPDWLKGAPAKSNKGAQAQSPAGARITKPTKPTGEARPPPSSQNEVIRLLQRILGRSLSKDDVVYTDAEGSTTLTFPNYPDQAFTGEGEDTKAAQAAAALAALSFLEPIVSALPPKEPKEAKQRPKQDKRKAAADGEAGEQPAAQKAKAGFTV